MHSSSDISLGNIVKSNCCIGCGLCAYLIPERVKMHLDYTGQIQPQVQDGSFQSGALYDAAMRVCPFSDAGPHENALGPLLYSKTCSYHPEIGYFANTYAGHVANLDHRLNSSSGGIVTWLGSTMLQERMIDGVIHVTPRQRDSTNPLLFKYSISTTLENLWSGAKSKYYPVELSQVLTIVKETPGRYVLIGVPCFIKAARRLAAIDATIAARLPYMIGLVCGHLKSSFFAELLACQLGVPYENLSAFDFRVKLPGRSASGYGVSAIGGGNGRTEPSSALFGADWGLHLFRYGACYFCDDVFAETADIAVGDAWLPAYNSDWRGDSIVVTRHAVFAEMIENGIKSAELVLDRIPPSQAAASQSGGLRDRREDILWRMESRRRARQWHPAKRDFGNCMPTWRRKKLIQTRVALCEAGLALWATPEVRGNLQIFIRHLRPLLRRYRWNTRGPTRILAGWAGDVFQRIAGNLRLRLP